MGNRILGADTVLIQGAETPFRNNPGIMLPYLWTMIENAPTEEAAQLARAEYDSLKTDCDLDLTIRELDSIGEKQKNLLEAFLSFTGEGDGESGGTSPARMSLAKQLFELMQLDRNMTFRMKDELEIAMEMQSRMEAERTGQGQPLGETSGDKDWKVELKRMVPEGSQDSNTVDAVYFIEYILSMEGKAWDGINEEWIRKAIGSDEGKSSKGKEKVEDKMILD